jgi:aromatic-L-amino-acid decarboxylase
MYCSEHAHSSVEKAGLILGLGRAGVRKIPVDAGFRMRADALAEAIDEDLHAGWRPFYVAATVGTTSSTSIYPVPAIADLCARQALWLHVDAAYGGSLAVAPEFRHILAGCERADSFVVNPHKWLFTPLDFSAFYVRDADTLTRAFSLLPDYLRTAEGDAGAVRNYMDYGVQLGRRFRALKFWMIVRTYGVDGMAARLREHVRLAQLFAAWVDAAPDFERLAPTPMSTVCFRASPAGVSDLDPLNEALMNRVNATGKAFLSHTRLNDHFSLRLAIGNIHTAERHVRETWELLQSELKRLV